MSMAMTGDLSFDDRVAIVTGAARGMGRAHALFLSARGARVVVNDLADADGSADGVVAEIEKAGGAACSNTDDISSMHGAQALVDRAVDTYGRVDILVNNAGVMPLARFDDLAAEMFDFTLKVNTYGPFFTTKAAWPHFIEQGYGRVVMVSSSAGVFGLPQRVHYAASKAAMVGMTRGLACDGWNRGICVNTLLPSAVTDMTTPPARKRAAERLAMPNTDDGVPAMMERSAGLVSPMVAWLSHEQCKVTGEIFEAGFGHVARVFIANAKGYDNPNLTAEDIRDHFAQIMDTESWDSRDSFAKS
jgi:NAD(P)-dependent dehydrogenase (short-subunit alcohol dehydrogenase family)